MAYGKIFPEIFDSTLMADGGMNAVYTFMSLITLKNQHGIVPIDPRILSRKIGLELDDLLESLEILQRRDPESNLDDFEGRRIIPLSEMDDLKENRGYYVVNHEHYRKKSSKEDRTEQNRLAQQRRRDAKKESGKSSASVSNSQQESASVSTRQHESAQSAHTDTDTDTDTYLKPKDMLRKKRKENEIKIKKQIQHIFEHWKDSLQHPRAVLDKKREQIIRRSLKLGYTTSDLIKAINGCGKSPHNMGFNDSNRRYDSISLIFRDADHIDKFIQQNEQPLREPHEKNSGNRGTIARGDAIDAEWAAEG